MTRESLKIGRYTEEEIFQYMTDVEGSMLGRSMYDAIFNTIHALITEKNQLKKDNETLQNSLQTQCQSLQSQINYLRRSIERKEEQYVLAQSKIDEAIEFTKDHIFQIDGDKDFEYLLQILERTDK